MCLRNIGTIRAEKLLVAGGGRRPKPVAYLPGRSRPNPSPMGDFA